MRGKEKIACSLRVQGRFQWHVSPGDSKPLTCRENRIMNKISRQLKCRRKSYGKLDLVAPYISLFLCIFLKVLLLKSMFIDVLHVVTTKIPIHPLYIDDRGAWMVANGGNQHRLCRPSVVFTNTCAPNFDRDLVEPS